LFDRPICHSRKLALAQAFRPKAALSVSTIHLVAISFDTTAGRYQVALSDVQTVQQYLGFAAPVIAAYCSQYGTGPLAVSPEIYTVTVNLQGQTYTDADLQGWVNNLVLVHGLGPSDALVFLNPPGVVNSEAPVSMGILGYHGAASVPYSFVNALGSGFSVNDAKDIYALALSHEIEEMVVDPNADLSKPEVADPCAGNCRVDYRNTFDANGNWLGGWGPQMYAFFVAAVAKPATVSQCPSSFESCSYAPPVVEPPPPLPAPPTSCEDVKQRAIAALAHGQFADAFILLIEYIECLAKS